MSVRSRRRRFVAASGVRCALLALALVPAVAQDDAAETSPGWPSMLAIAKIDDARVEFVTPAGETLAQVETDPGPRAFALRDGVLYVANRGVGSRAGSSVTQIDLTTLTSLGSPDLCVRCAPRDLAFDAEGRLWITAQAHRVLYWAEPPYSDPSGSVTIGLQWPTEVIASDSGALLFVGFRSGGRIAVVDPESKRAAFVAASASPVHVLERPGAPEVWTVSDSGGAVASVSYEPGGKVRSRESDGWGFAAGDAEFLPSGGLMLVSESVEGRVTLVDVEGGNAVAALDLGGSPGAVALHPSASRAAVAVLHEPAGEAAGEAAANDEDAGEVSAAIVVVEWSTETNEIREVARFATSGRVAEMIWLP